MTTDVAAFLQTWPGNDQRIDQFTTLLGLFQPGRVVDLGAGPSPFGQLAADAGFEVTAVDARRDLWPTDPRITWVERDVREFPLDGYDLILCLGLFYHFPVGDQVALLRRAAGTPMILDTHLANQATTTQGGYQGLLYTEIGQGELGSDPLGSVGNPQSFWPTQRAFRQMTVDCGYRLVLSVDPWVKGDRAFFVLLP